MILMLTKDTCMLRVGRLGSSARNRVRRRKHLQGTVGLFTYKTWINHVNNVWQNIGITADGNRDVIGNAEAAFRIKEHAFLYRLIDCCQLPQLVQLQQIQQA